MAQIERAGRVTFGDARFDVWEEPGERVMGAWEQRFKKDVFKRIVQQFNRLGWEVGPQEHIFTGNNSRFCRKGDLKADLRLCGRHIEILFFQSINCPTRPDDEGRYERDKEQCMPYLLRLEMQRTRNRLRDYLCGVFTDYEFTDEEKGRLAKRGPGKMTAIEWVENANRNSGHYSEALGHAPIGMTINAKSADGGEITHGARVYAIDYRYRVVVGTAYYNLNNMWWVVTGKYGLINVHSGAIYLSSPGDIRRKRNARCRRQRLEKELSSAIKSMNFKRAQVLKEILFPVDEELYLIWHKGHSSWYGSDFSGYSNSINDAGKYTRAELGRYATENELTKPVPLSKAA
ncbi:hypothetical protein [Vreelandella alkaliphila]|uniref:Uncharacterized protein n=1 Tax=Vreelandella alkaliphila TaxID=272774 RepID=A0AAJ2S0N6_9GAMM|nr:hypothetical protein [Halomonas alkaliphila]MDX5979586.1 hypothetical protein [Halomonas alkaliphila]